MEEDKSRRTWKSGGVRYRADRGVWIASRELEPDKRGRRVRIEASGKTESAAIAALNKKYRDRTRNKPVASQKGSVKEYLDRWMESVCRPNSRPATYDAYAHAIDRYINPAIGSLKMRSVNVESIRNMRQEVIRICEKANAEARKSGSSKTISGVSRANYCQAVLAAAFTDAMREGVMEYNPASSQYVKRAKKSQDSILTLSSSQAKALIASAVKAGDPMASRWATALITGTRQGETIGLQWSRVDFENKKIHFTKQLVKLTKKHGCGKRDQGEWPCGYKFPTKCPNATIDASPEYLEQCDILDGDFVLGPTKTARSARAIPMPPPLEKILRHHRAVTANDYNPHDLVWHRPDGMPFSRGVDHMNWKEALDTAGLERVRLHSARHTAASLMADMGVDRQVVMEIFGHTTESTTATYTHLSESLQREALEQLSGDILDMFANEDGVWELE